ncbi:GNAT family N-acetyltransferase [Thermobrachium celere]|uniref:GNAT family N-acetyltransferase n=1 Tax=Thermobrachium celere TaxID=53422 RepID=UPI0019433A10|nr:GNAT family N-acetyltransferase [Thermobrachium celere]GFR35571.1 N-acetyltransferase [Thermobrachium celere]
MFGILKRIDFKSFYEIKKTFNLPTFHFLTKSKLFQIDENIKVIKIKNYFYVFAFNTILNLHEIISILKEVNISSKIHIKIKYTNTKLIENIDKSLLEKYNNFKTMKLDLNNIEPFLDNLKYKYFPNLRLINVDIQNYIDTRIWLQNSIFNTNSKKRLPIDKNYIFREMNNSCFLKDYCYILYFDEKPIGYGQIIIDNKKYYLVNFGIIEEYRHMGFGYIFLCKIIDNIILKKQIKTLYLNVDNDNIPAINLYKKLGFIEVCNNIELKL